MHVHHICALCPWKSEEGVRFPGVIQMVVNHMWVLRTEPSLQPPLSPSTQTKTTLISRGPVPESPWYLVLTKERMIS